LYKNDEAKMSVKMINFKKPKESYIIHNPSLLLMLFAIFFWFFGYFGIESFFSLYAKDSLGLGAGDASQMLAYMAGTFLATAIPAGFIGARFGRKVTMLTGLLLMIISFVIIFLFPEVTIIKIMFIVSGCGWALININSYPSIIELAPEGHIGQYTGLYYAFSFTASILSPILFGFISDLVGNYRMIFLSADISFIIALFFFLPTKRLDGGKNNIT
jgi:maltose/moltooligosaccharide transporter